MRNIIHNENCLDTMGRMPDNYLDSIVTDPPYGLSFMGKKWDASVPDVAIWKECLRVLKPGGYLLAFAGTRTQHRMAVNIEDAGFEIRDLIMWVYGSGFPKSHNISKAIDKAAGATRKVIGSKITNIGMKGNNFKNKSKAGEIPITKSSSLEAVYWDGWGTALKPALEPITMARKPLSEKTIAANILRWGAGGINIDASRVPLNGDYKSKANGRPSQTGLSDKYDPITANKPDTTGRFPANLIHDGSIGVVQDFPHTKSGSLKKGTLGGTNKNSYNKMLGVPNKERIGSEGSASRFFYCAKASKKDRGLGNSHPTVKPSKLMRYLIRLVTQTGGTTYDPFSGSGTSAISAILEDFNFIGSEISEESCGIANSRIAQTFKEILGDLY